MKKSLLTILQYLFFLGLGIFFVWLAVKEISYQDWQHIKLSLSRARHWLIIPVVLLLLLSHYSRAIRWKILMETLGYHPSVFNTWAAVMIGYMVNAGVPRLGEVVKCTLLARYENVRADKLVGTILIERVVDLVCLFTVFVLALIFQGHVIGDYTAELFSNFIKDKSGHVSAKKTAIIIGSTLLFFSLLFFLLKRFGHIDAVAKVKTGIKNILHGLNSIRLIQHKGLFFFHSLLIWALYLASTTIGMYALKETDHLGLGAGLTTLAVGSVGMVITPGGIGAYPLLVAKLMELYGLDYKTTGMALGWLLWTVQTLIVLGGGLIFSGLFSHHNKKRKSRAAVYQPTTKDSY
ncbi:MAG: flippase-like domain-containing protein [Bacteroidota bacterium]|nr:flippase-like domain-containing protein [Flavisolibacter sp.]MBD0350432.1 flippase-like domain-containing protein [Flavisolibacter sp.]MBD0375258.1 flippase-like domain-containing protein [Flavisolibacter sp.]MDQ3842558.1 flippase-like domain-containing protein [Bacteroidota bacterium]